ncbi:MAG: glycine cleavage system protein GcvH [Dehalococcoidia bacterium]|nr:glycine cleavage system protein GcvH [Dehalococcoidia bacterium]
MEAPDDRKYSKEHEWVVLHDDGTALVGISDFAQNQLGDVVFVELPKVGAALAQFDQMGEIESVKAVSDLYTPVGGEVVEVNADVVNKPETVNEDPYGKGWLIKVRMDNAAELDNLMDAAQYAALTA